LAVGLLAACSHAGSNQPSPSATSRSSPSPNAGAAPTPSIAPPADGFGFAVIGDFGSGDASERTVANAIREWSSTHRLDALVTTGDNVYESGAPDELGAAWGRPYGWVAEQQVPVVAALGNHDVVTDAGAPELRLFDMPGRWYAGTIGPVRFIVLDANDPTDPEQMAFLRTQLAADARAPWTVAVFHQPAFSCSFHGSTPEVDEAWVPLFARGGVDLVLNGHDHAYERFAPIDGVTYVVDGSGGATLYPASTFLCPNGTPDYVFANARDHAFVALTATAHRLVGQAITADGRVIDAFELSGA